MSPELIQALYAGAGVPSGSSRGRARYVNGRLVLDDVQQPQTKGRGGTATSLISEGGALGGAAIGAGIGSAVPILGTAIGGIIGAGVGAFGGRLAENKVRDDRYGVGDAAKEGALSAVLSGPLRLAKYGGTAAKGLKAGASLENALINAADDATKVSLRGMIGNKAHQAGDKLIAKQFRLNPQQQFNFNNKHGVTATEVIKKLGINSADDINTKLPSMYDEFGNISKSIPNFTTKQVTGALEETYKPLLDSVLPAHQALGKQLQGIADNIATKYKNKIPSSVVNKIRQEADAAVKYTLRGTADEGANRQTASALRSLMQKTADKAGLKTTQGLSYKQIGRNINQLEDLAEIVGKQEFLGSGSLPLNLPTLFGGGVGAAVGGPLGATGAAIGTAAVNSNAGRKLTRVGVDKVGNALINSGSKATGPLNNSLWGAVRGQLGEGLLTNSTQQPTSLQDAIINQSANNSQSTPNSIPSSMNPMNVSNIAQAPNDMMGSQYPQTDEMSMGYAQQNPYSRENLIYDIQRDPQNANEYMKIYQMYQEVFAQPEMGGMGDMSQSSRNALASSDNAINTVNQLEQLFTNAGSGSGRIGGSLKGLAARAGFDEDAKIYDSLANASVTQIAKALAGSGAGTVSDMDAKVIMAALPTLRDTPAEARAKFLALKQRLENAKQNTLLYGGAGQETGSLEDTLMQYQ